jgi:hypothetical protein
MSAGSQQQQQQEMPTWVRNYVHYDQLASGLYKQCLNARKLRDGFEDKIIHQLTTQGMGNAILQVSQGKYQLKSEQHLAPLSITNLEALLHQYYNQKIPHGPDETNAILQFIKSNRQHTSNIRIRKIDESGAVPAPPGGLKPLPGI